MGQERDTRAGRAAGREKLAARLSQRHTAAWQRQGVTAWPHSPPTRQAVRNPKPDSKGAGATAHTCQPPGTEQAGQGGTSSEGQTPEPALSTPDISQDSGPLHTLSP